MHLFFVWKVVITGVYCQPESSRAAYICTRPRLHPAAMNYTHEQLGNNKEMTQSHNRHKFKFVNFVVILSRKASVHTQHVHVCLCVSSSSLMRRQMLLFRASGLWSKPTFVTRRSSKRPSCICKPKEPQITSLASHLPLNSFST